MTTLTLDRHRGHAFHYDVVVVGYNYRPTEITSALGLIQLDKLERNNQRRRALAEYYLKRLKSSKDIRIPFKESIRPSSWHIFPILLNENIPRDAIMAKLKERGIQTSVHYRPIHTFTSFSTGKSWLSLPNSEFIGNHAVTLPLFPRMTEQDVDFVVESLDWAIHSSTRRL